MAERDPDDWPTVALALALNLPIWTPGQGLHRLRSSDLLHRRAARRLARGWRAMRAGRRGC
ncbi:MAG TPA: PIN domain-containing protein [Chloroflexota bacterium]|nr:PIN domain-containing protein [Chloroflexota bacterium]